VPVFIDTQTQNNIIRQLGLIIIKVQRSTESTHYSSVCLLVLTGNSSNAALAVIVEDGGPELPRSFSRKSFSRADVSIPTFLRNNADEANQIGSSLSTPVSLPQ
jgi:hypothetical protein